MLITRECDYAVRIIRDLAGSGKKTVREISESEQIPHPYAYKILKKLEKGGLVTGYRGAAGGYALARDPDDLTLFDIFMSVEDELHLNACLQQNYQCPQNTAGNPCRVHMEFQRLQQVLADHLKSRTMKEILGG